MNWVRELVYARTVCCLFVFSFKLNDLKKNILLTNKNCTLFPDSTTSCTQKKKAPPLLIKTMGGGEKLVKAKYKPIRGVALRYQR